jgi:hypothetical protein
MSDAASAADEAVLVTPEQVGGRIVLSLRMPKGRFWPVIHQRLRLLSFAYSYRLQEFRTKLSGPKRLRFFGAQVRCKWHGLVRQGNIGEDSDRHASDTICKAYDANQPANSLGLGREE